MVCQYHIVQRVPLVSIRQVTPFSPLHHCQSNPTHRILEGYSLVKRWLGIWEETRSPSRTLLSSELTPVSTSSTSAVPFPVSTTLPCMSATRRRLWRRARRMLRRAARTRSSPRVLMTCLSLPAPRSSLKPSLPLLRHLLIAGAHSSLPSRLSMLLSQYNIAIPLIPFSLSVASIL